MKASAGRAGWTAPRSPLSVRAGDAILRAFPKKKLHVGRMMDAARKATDLSDFGEEFFVPALTVLCRSMNEEAELTPIGALIQQKRITDLLKNRLRLEAEFKRRPESQEVGFQGLLLIAGLQRTGTTLLHRLLSTHPEARTLPSWEGLNPAPLPSDPDNRKRIALAEQAVSGLKFLAPDFFRIHPLDATAPEEEVLLMELSFMSQTSEAILHVPTYAKWLEQQDQTPVYAYLRRVLQLLFLGTPERRRWVLKSPNHLEWLDVFLRVFPEGRVIQTHRNPLETVASFCSMVAHGRAVFSRSVDAHEIGRHWLLKLKRVMTRALAVRQVAPERFIDLDYAELLNDPQSAVAHVHESLGIPHGPEEDERVVQELSHSRKDKFGVHKYQLSDFGLTESAVREALGEYMAAHGF